MHAQSPDFTSMTVSPLIFALVFVVALGLSAALTPLGIYLGKRWGLVDHPGGRRKHKGIISRIGGLMLYPRCRRRIVTGCSGRAS